MRALSRLAALSAMALLLAGCSKHEEEPPAAATVAAAAEPAPPPAPPAGVIDPKADEILKKACTLVAGTQSFKITTDEVHDRIRRTGEKVQLTSSREMIVQRPNKVWMRMAGTEKAASIWYDGTTLALKGEGKRMYAQAEMPPTLDQALDFMAARGGIRMPLADLLYTDPYTSYVGPETNGTYVGLEDVGGTPAHHLAFTDPAVDFDIWVQDGEQAWPKRILLTYKNSEGQPKSDVTFKTWEVNPAVKPDTFTFTPSKGDVKIPFAGQKRSNPAQS